MKRASIFEYLLLIIAISISFWFIFYSGIFATDLPSDFSDGNILTASELNNWKEERDGDLLPISQYTKNFITSSCNIGSSTYKWNNLYLTQYAYFGTDVTLYRSAADILKTDDSLTVALGLNIGTATGATTGQIKSSDSILSRGYASIDVNSGVASIFGSNISWGASKTNYTYINTGSGSFIQFNGTDVSIKTAASGTGNTTATTVLRALWDGTTGETTFYGGINVGNATGAGTGQIKASGSIVSTGNISTVGKIAISSSNPTEELSISGTSGSTYSLIIDTALQNSISGYNVKARTSTGNYRFGSIGVGRYFGIANSYGILNLSESDGSLAYIMVQDDDDVIINTSPDPTGGIVIGTQTSDERLKSNIRSLNYGLTEILKLKPIRYKRNDKIEIGFGAQTTQKIIPEAVYNTKEKIDDSGKTKLAMDYSRIIPVLVNAIKELKQEINVLKYKNKIKYSKK